ncbi:transcriptional regulator [Streptomyces yangpuensis]|uniref:ParB/RepB/Spo0J family partition protein n=1 Tax=Streptomyces TaxID=1883 RepID=UPI000B1E3428|nr:transcriptional regulator [Streptomyces sp. NRRL S-378]
MRATHPPTTGADPENEVRPTGSGAEPGEPPCVEVPLTVLAAGESLRSAGEDEEHTARLAETEDPLPPILVDRRTLSVIDGRHRLAAARLRGQRTISVRYFDGSPDDAFLRGVEANVTHGLPLSQADRRAAAERIVATHPHLSDRSIARASGLGAKTVAAIRQARGAGPGEDVRVGKDGRARPVNSRDGRQRAAEALALNPQASLREVARIAGVSPTTVGEVRRQLAADREVHGADGADHAPGPLDAAAVQAGPADPPGTGAGPAAPRVPPQPDPTAVLKKLVRDPALRHRESGRHLLRLLQQNAIDQRMWADLAAAVPPHSGGLVADLARSYAETWTAFAQELGERPRARTVQRTTG